MTEENNVNPGSTPEEPQAQPAAPSFAAPAGAASVPLEQASPEKDAATAAPTEALPNPYGAATAEQAAVPQPPQNPYGQTQQPQSPYEQPQQAQNPYGQTAQQPAAYGAPAQQQYYTPQGVAPQSYTATQAPTGSGKALAALLCGIGAIVFSETILVGIILGVIAIILASQYVKSFGKDGKATAGKVTGIIGIVFSVLMLVFWIFFFGVLVAAISSSESISSDYTYSYSGSSDPDSGSGSAGSGSGGLTEIGDDADVASLKAAAEAEMAALQNPDEAKLKEISANIDEYFTYLTTDKLSDYGVDATDLAKKMTSNITYEFSDISAYGDTGSVSATVKSITMLDFLEAWYDALEASGDYSTEGQSAAMQVALEKMEPSENHLYLTFERSGDTWTVEEDEYNDAQVDVLGIYL